MLRNTCVWWGRWNSRDFLKGRGKKAGAVHVRHTHGSKGRYKRLTDMYGLRDGRRHAQNSMKGGLGIKLGGGLFGLRMPRQHLLSTMTREQFDLEMYGHPNITNPYRDLMDEHPDLKAVMESASVMPHLVVLLPRVKRDLSRSNTNNSSRSSGPTELPAAWRQVGDELTALFDSFVLTTQVHLCTLDASVAVCFPSGMGTSSSTPQRQTAAGVHAALLALYQQHCRTGRKLVEERSSLQPRHRKPSLALFGAEMQRSPSNSNNNTPKYMSAALAKLVHEEAPLVSVHATDAEAAVTERQGMVCAKGVADLVHEFRERFPEALCVCLRPSAILAHPTHHSSNTHSVDTPSTAATPAEARSHTALEQLKAMLENKSKTSQKERHAPSTPVKGHEAPLRTDRLLRKADVDPDTQKGVWATPPTAHLGELLRWQYANRDPRAHSSDSMPHKARRLPCVVLADLSKRRTHTTGQQGGKVNTPQWVQSLLPDEVSNALVTLRYVPLKSTNLEETLAELREWHVECSWKKMLDLKHKQRADEDVDAHHGVAAHSS